MQDKELLEQWINGLRISHRAHEQAASHFDLRNRVLGTATVIFSTVVGTSIVADAGSSNPLAWKIAGSALSLTAAVLAAIQGGLKYGELAATHRQVARRIGSIRRECEQTLAQAAQAPLPADFLTQFRRRWDKVDTEAPSVPQRIWDRAAAQVRKSLDKAPPAPATAGK